MVKTCSKCKKEKKSTAFYKCKFVSSGLSSWCKECDSEKRKKYSEKNKEKIAKYQKEFYEKNKSHISKRNKNHYEKNKYKFTVKSSLRRAKKLQATPKWANKRYIELFYLLAKEESIRTGMEVEVDHIIPLINKHVCGLHCEYNLQLLFKKDNRSKGNSFKDMVNGYF